jgi:ubiquitin carboxyl-terminal hydrolase L3
VAAKGDSAVPDNAEDEVYFHYICFVRSEEDGCLYELDGDRKGPVSLGKVDVGEHGDILTADTVSLIRNYINQGEGNIGYNLMALVNRSAAQ